jgi:hypothetical protein
MAGPPWPGPQIYIYDAEVTSLDDAVEMGIDEIESGRCAPVSQQPRLNMRRFERLLEQWIVEQINLPYREIVRGSPINVEVRQFLSTRHLGFFALGCGFRHRIEFLWNGSRPKLYYPGARQAWG